MMFNNIISPSTILKFVRTIGNGRTTGNGRSIGNTNSHISAVMG